MRITYLSGAPRVSTSLQAELAGPRAHVLGVIQGFESLGHSVDRFIVGDRLPRSWSGQGSEQAVVGSRLRVAVADVVRIALGQWNAWQSWREFGKASDMVYERFAAFQALGLPFARRGVPWILETNAPLFHEARFERKSIMMHGAARALELRAYRACTVLVCVTETLRDLLVREAGIDDSKTVVVRNGVDTKTLDPDSVAATSGGGVRFYDQFTVGFIGGLTSWQAIDQLISAVATMRRQGIPICAAIAGDGPLRSELEAHARRLHVSDYVRFTGHLPWTEVPRFLSCIDVGYSGQTLRPIGQMYGSPLKLYEYMAMARPAVVSAFEDARQVIRHRETGFLFEPGNQDGLIRALTDAYESRERLPDMGRRSRIEVVANHSWESRVAQMMTDIRPILSRRRLGSR